MIESPDEPNVESNVESNDALEIARTVVREASALLAGATDNVGAVRTKSSLRDLVTEWDTRVEELIRRRLGELAGEVPILAEESGGDAGAGEKLRWLIDPIDGTVNFVHGLPIFGVTVALEVDARPQVGVVAAPALGWEFWARRGGGAYMNGQRIGVSSIASLDQAMLATGFPYDRATTGHNFAEWEHFQRTAGACRRLGAASLDLCMVARGWFDGYWESRLNPWDLAAGALLVEEAGGVVTSIDGGPFRASKGSAVASNGAIHDGILAELATVAAGRVP